MDKDMRVAFVSKHSQDEVDQMMGLAIPFLVEAMEHCGKTTGLTPRAVLSCVMSAAAWVAEDEGCREDLAKVLEKWIVTLRSGETIRLRVSGSA